MKWVRYIMGNQPTKLNKYKIGQIVLVVGILIVVLSVAYYLFVYVPKKEAIRMEQKKQTQENESAQNEAKLQKENEMQCARLEQAEDQRTAKQCNDLSGAGNCNMTGSECTFNQNLNACIYYRSYDYPDVGIGGGRIFKKYVENLNTKQEIISVTYSNQNEYTDDKKKEIDDFWNKYSEFFNDADAVRYK